VRYLAAAEEFFPERPGGAGRVAWELAKLVRDRGHEAALVCGAADGESAPRVHEQEGIAIVRYPSPRLRAWDPRRLSARTAAVADAVRRLGRTFDVVHSHTLAPGLGAFAAAGRGARRLATIHSPAVLEQRINWRHSGATGRLKMIAGEPLLRRAERRLYETADGLSALSRYTIGEIGDAYGAPLAGRIALIPWWAEVGAPAGDRGASRRALGWEVEGFALFTLRRLVPRMGLDTLLEALGRVPTDKPWTLYVAGDGPERGRLEALASACGRRDRVRFLGRISDEALEQAYTACDLFVLPTRALECFGLIALEALGRGRPVLGARVGAIPEMLEPVLPGWLFSPGDSSELASALGAVLSGERRAPSADQLRAYAHGRYGRDRVQASYLEWLEGRR
jgi:glycosyltransferase involved in cell wall biosynthesis